GGEIDGLGDTATSSLRPSQRRSSPPGIEALVCHRCVSEGDLSHRRGRRRGQRVRDLNDGRAEHHAGPFNVQTVLSTRCTRCKPVCSTSAASCILTVLPHTLFFRN